MNKEDVIKIFKNISRAAKAIGISRQAIQQWDQVPPLREIQINEIQKRHDTFLKGQIQHG